MTTQKAKQKEDKFNCCNCGTALYEDNLFNFDSYEWCETCFYDKTFCCENCNNTYYRDNYAQDGYCTSCYEEEHGSQFNFINIPFKIEKSKTFKENPYKNTCGLEIECYNKKPHEMQFNFEQLVKYGFNQTEDGSLNNNGVEFTSHAFNGDLLFNKVRDFTKELNRRGYFIDDTCGLHIHIKLSKNAEFLKKMLLFYLKYENFFYEMLPKSRQNNNYCSSLREKLFLSENKINDINIMEKLHYLIYNTRNKTRLKYAMRDKYNNKRYCWLNLHSIFHRGTLEIRSHSGTLNADKINNWFKIHLTSLDFIKKHDFDFIKAMPINRELFLSIFDSSTKQYIQSRWNRFNPLMENDLFTSFKILSLKSNDLKFIDYEEIPIVRSHIGD